MGKRKDAALERHLLKMKAMGITISSTPAIGHEADFVNRPLGIIQAAADKLGMGTHPAEDRLGRDESRPGSTGTGERLTGAHSDNEGGRMKIAELIQQLETIQAKEGDIDIALHNFDAEEGDTCAILATVEAIDLKPYLNASAMRAVVLSPDEGSGIWWMDAEGDQ